MKTDQKVPRPKNWLLVKSRQWHTWGGLSAGAFILLVAASGIILNYKQPVFSALGLESNPVKNDVEKSSTREAGRIETSTDLSALPVSFSRALELAKAEWGAARLEKIELKEERGSLTYKVKHKNGDELWINAVSGKLSSKNDYKKPAQASDGSSVQRTDWGKIMIDLHTGKIGGETGKAVMSFAALVLLFLVLSGAYLWVKPLFIRQRNKGRRQPSDLQPI